MTNVVLHLELGSGFCCPGFVNIKINLWFTKNTKNTDWKFLEQKAMALRKSSRHSLDKYLAPGFVACRAHAPSKVSSSKIWRRS